MPVLPQEKFKFFNRETSFERSLDRNIIGFTRDFSDAYVQAVATLGKGRKQVEDVVRAYFTMGVNEGGRSTRFGLKDIRRYLVNDAEVESTIQE